jgi:hypothetical protein
MPQNSRLKVLILCDFDGRDANVIRDFLYSFNAYSRHSCYYFHDCQNLDASFDFSGYDAIVIFWSCFWFWGVPIRDAVADNIARAPAVKVLFLQDEYRYVRTNNRMMARLGVQVMCTCVTEADHALVYPRSLIPSLEAVHTVLTGYVPDYMEKLKLTPLETRPIDIGYRSRVMPYHLGDLAREKLTIAERFDRIATAHGFVADISVREVDRLYGKQWLQFLESCKIALGTESGASVVDFSGELGKRCAQYLKNHPAASYEEVRQAVFAHVDGRVVIQAISPRIFESVAYGNVLVLHEGEYSGILQSDEHFIAVKKDYSNVDEVVERMRDVGLCNRLRTAAHRDLIAGGRYSYRAFVQWFDAILEQHAPTVAVTAAPVKSLFYARNYLTRGQQIVPRGSKFVRLPRPRLATLREQFPSLQSIIPQVLLVLGLLWDVPSLKRILVGHLLRPYRWRPADIRSLWPDLVRLGLLRCLRGKHVVVGDPFRVTADWRGEERACYLVSTPAAEGDGGLVPDGLPPDLSAALETGDCLRLVWDHAGVACWAAVQLGTAPFAVLMEGNGAYRFQGLARFCKSYGPATGVLLRELLRAGPPALQAHRGLRLLALGYFLTAAFLRFVLFAPLNIVMQMLLVAGLLWDMPTLRRTLVSHVLHPSRWRRVSPAHLWGDLLRLGVLRCLRGRRMVADDPFRVTPFWQSEDAACRLVSAAVDDERDAGLAPGGLPKDVRAALTAEPCRKLVWDHSPVAEWTAFVLWRNHYVFFGVGARGTRTFHAVADLCQEPPDKLGNVVRELLDEQTSALRSWRRLRPVVMSLVLPLMVMYYTRRLATLPWRAAAKLYAVQPIFRTLLVLGLLADVPALRRTVARYICRPWLWRRNTPISLFSDLGRLGLLRCLQGNELILERSFKVTAQWHKDNQVCRLVSAACRKEEVALAAGGLPDTLRDALDADRCKQLVWDHSALGDSVAFRFGRYRQLRMGVWKTGVASFRTLRRVLHKTSTDRAAVVRQLLGDGPCGLQSRKALRPLVWAYVAPFVLADVLVRVPLAFCWRAAETACGLARARFGGVKTSPIGAEPAPSTQYRKSA